MYNGISYQNTTFYFVYLNIMVSYVINSGVCIYINLFNFVLMLHLSIRAIKILPAKATHCIF